MNLLAHKKTDIKTALTDTNEFHTPDSAITQKMRDYFQNKTKQNATQNTNRD